MGEQDTSEIVLGTKSGSQQTKYLSPAEDTQYNMNRAD